jgi:quercetin dioxygenase-like cupin family protein
MAIVERPAFAPVVDDADPDDHRPNSRWTGPLADPVSDRYVRDLSVILEHIGPGDAIPLHRHGVDEVIVVESGEVELRLGGETRRVTGRSVAFVPAGVPHGARNVGAADAAYTAFFGTTAVDIEYLERNPAPGTEGDPARPPVTYDARA